VIPDGPARGSATLTVGFGATTAALVGTTAPVAGVALLATGVLLWGAVHPARAGVFAGAAGLFAVLLYGAIAGLDSSTAVAGTATAVLAYDSASRAATLRRQVADAETRDIELVGTGGAICVAVTGGTIVYAMSDVALGPSPRVVAAVLLVGLLVLAWLAWTE
jgi:hypothetical protein